MTSRWKRIFSTFFAPAPPAEPGSLAPPRRRDYPRTYRPDPGNARIDQPEIFDPALRQYPRAFRVGEPSFTDGEIADAWRAARRRAMAHVLRLVSESPWRDHLVLRGSVVLQAWFPHAAREPGDLDYVVTPQVLRPADAWAAEFQADLARRVDEQPRPAGTGDNLEFRADAIAVDDIWTYDRAPGRRMIFPWIAGTLPGGAVQLDIVFGEELFAPPVLTPMQTDDGGAPLVVPTASKELSLAWKLVWLENDCYPQGKDLYDAALLAEHTRLPPDLLDRARAATATADGRPVSPLDPGFPMNLDCDWDAFHREYPWVRGDLEEWKTCLARALAPTFTPRTPNLP